MMMRNASGALIEVRPMMRNTANVLVEVLVGARTSEGGTVNPPPTTSPVSASASPDTVSGATRFNRAVTTNATTVTVAGGVAPYSYAWADGTDMHPTSPSSATTQFVGNPPQGETYTENFTCTATDAKGQTASATILATVSNYGGGGGVQQ